MRRKEWCEGRIRRKEGRGRMFTEDGRILREERDIKEGRICSKRWKDIKGGKALRAINDGKTLRVINDIKKGR